MIQIIQNLDLFLFILSIKRNMGLIIYKKLQISSLSFEKSMVVLVKIVVEKNSLVSLINFWFWMCVDSNLFKLISLITCWVKH